MIMALVLALTEMPLNALADEPGAGTATEDSSKFEGDGMNQALSLSEFAEYSRCYAKNATFAENHQNDTILLNPAEAYWKLEDSGENYFESIGTNQFPFRGTIRINAYESGQSLVLLTNKPLFNVVYDSVSIYQGSTTTEVAVEFIRMGNTTVPLMANEVRHGDAASANWEVILSSQTKTETISGANYTYGNSYTYGGVIGKMSEGAELSLTFTDNSTEQQGAAVSRSGAQGTLCGEMAQGASLTATYVNSTGRAITVGSGGNILTGGLVGSMKGAKIELSSIQGANFTVNAGNSNAGLIAGYVGVETNSEVGSTVTLADGLSFTGTITGSNTNSGTGAGGLVGKLEKSDIKIGESGIGSVTLSGVTVSGNAKIGGVIGYFVPASTTANALTNVTYSMQNCTIGGSNPGGIVGEFDAIGGENIDISKFVFSGTKLNKGSSGSTGGVFGILNGNGEVTITTGTDGEFNAPESSVHYGGVIGIYKSSALTDTLNLENLNVTNVKQTSKTQKLGGIILDVPNATYIKVNDVEVNVTGGAELCTTSNPFGGIVSRIGYTAPTDSSVGNGSFIDIAGDFKLTTSSAYNGGAIAGSFQNGVVRLAGTTDISGAQTASGYGQLIYDNGTTLIFAKGFGSDASGKNDSAHWTFKRNDSTTASDLGQWGEVVRLFGGNSAENENVGIVTVDETAHTVTLASTGKAISDTTSFAKLALNMQLNDGKDHGALRFADKTNSEKTQLLDAELTVSGKIDLSGTGLLGLMRDGGNGKYLKSSDNTFVGNPDFFTGTINGENDAEIELAVGEGYGVDSNGASLSKEDVGGRIYLSENWGHDAQGLLSFGKGVTLSNLKISGIMHVSRTAGSNHLYMAPTIGAMTNGATLTNVTITTVMTADKANNSKFYIGGVSGVFDGNDTTDNNGYTLAISGGAIKPVMTLTGTVGSDDNHENNNVYVGGVLGLLKGSDATKYKVSMRNTEISPQIKLGEAVANVSNSFIGGMIGYVKSNSTNEREIFLSTVTMNNALVEQKSQYSGGLLGAFWDRTQVTIDRLTITGAKVENKRNANDNRLSGLVYRATGNWDVKALSVTSTDFIATNNNHVDFGLIVNQGYNGNDGLYLNLRNSGYTLEGITIPVSTRTDYYVDEIVAKTADSEANVVSGGNGVGIININMNSDNGTVTKITGNGSTGTYQNKVLNNNKLVANSHARYYYNLDVIKSQGDGATDGEKFLMWSIYNHYAAENIKKYNVIANADISGLSDVDLSGLSYYPVSISGATLPAATYTFGFQAIKDFEEDSEENTDKWARYPDSTGDMKTNSETRRNQHYLMQNGLFQNVTGALNTGGRVIFAGDFGGVGSAGVLIGGTLTGTVDLTKGVTLKGVKPSISASPMLVNTINGEAADVNPEFQLTGLRQEDYPEKNTEAVASALIQSAKGTGMRLVFSDIKLDARTDAAFAEDNNERFTDAEWRTSANAKMNSAYGTSRSIFGTATFFHTLQSNSTDTIEYNYTYEEDWGLDNNSVAKRSVTYGQEVNVAENTTYSYYYKDDEEETQSGERRYYGTPTSLVNPVDDTDTWFDFSAGFLPYVGNKSKNDTYNISEIKVNFRSSGLVDGCGTYNDPYIITSGKLLTKVANYINSENAALDAIRLPNELNATWHDATKGDSEYKKNSKNYEKNDSNDQKAISGWTTEKVREYLAGAYYVISGDIELDSTFPGIGKGGASENGKTVFHGVIVGQKSGDKYPTIKNLSVNPFIYISNGSVVKNLNFVVDNTTPPNKNKPAELLSPITITQSSSGNSALYSYQDMTASGNTTARYYGGVFGEIMGGDNIIDNVNVTYNTDYRPIKLTGDSKHLIAAGGFAGAVVNGGLIFRGENSVTGFKVYRDSDTAENNALGSEDGKNLYVNPYVGRVINGYAVNEGSSDLDNTAKHYTIDKISAPTKDTDKLDVKFDSSTIEVPNAQALFVMSLITQSTAGTAVSSDGKYGVSQSYGINSNVFCGSNHLGDYSQVGAKKIVTDESGNEKQVIYTTISEIDDYNKKAIKDVANASDSTRETAIPYIIFTYTKADSGKYPARTITYNNAKFWDIKLAENADFNLSHYTSFRGIGCMGNKTLDYNMKIATFEGNNNTIKLSILESRYNRDDENYFHQENKSKTTAYSGEALIGDYGHDTNLHKLMGLGLFDYVSVNCDADHEYQFQNFTLNGNIIEKVYNKSGGDITGINDNSQLFCIGGVVGKRIYTETNNGPMGNKSDQNFKNITFDGLTISGAYSCGGLIGIDAFKEPLEMHIDGCNSTANGVNIIGGYYGNAAALRHGIGSFVGMTFWCRPYIDGKVGENATSDIYVSTITTHYEGDQKRCNVGGLIGYSGTGAEIKNINLKALPNSDAVIGAPNVANAAGFIGFAQTRATADNENTYKSQSVYIENCKLENISVKAKNSAAGFYGRCNAEDWGPKYIYISDSAIIGTGDTKPEIRAYGTGTAEDTNYVGGFVAGFFATYGKDTSIIQNSYISGYTIQGYYVGGMVGKKARQPMNFRNVYVKDCDIVTYGAGKAGGFVGYSNQNLNGYNMKIENVNFELYQGDSVNNTDNTDNAGAFIGMNSSDSITDHFVGVAKYHTNPAKVPTADIKTNGTNAKGLIVFADYTGQSLTESKNTENISSFGKTDNGGNITDQNKVPYLTLNPAGTMGTGEYLSGDGAYQLAENLTGYETYTSGKSAAVRIYADYAATDNKSGRAFSVQMTSPIQDDGTAVSLDSFFKQAADSSGFKISTWNREMGVKSGVDDFTLLVVNDANDPEQTTNLIDNYIRLMTGTSTHYMADSSGKYCVKVTPCRYNDETNRFELQSNVTAGLRRVGSTNALNNTDGKKYTNGYFQMDLANADSLYDDQFTLIDVQYYDPTTTASKDVERKIAYHLYVPVLTRKTINIQFEAVSLPGSTYKGSDYENKIQAEITAGRNANDPSKTVNSMDAWTTSYIRFVYPRDQVDELLKLGSNLQWNHDKKVSIVRNREANISDNAKLVLIDPNNNVDKAFYSTAGAFEISDDTRVIDFSEFTARSDGTGENFHEQTLYSLLYDKVTVVENNAGKGAYKEVKSKTTASLTFKIDGKERYFEFVGSSGTYDLKATEDITESYYLSLYVPKAEGQVNVVQIQSAGTMGAIGADGNAATGAVIRATVTPRLNAVLILGDFIRQEELSFALTSTSNAGNIITDANKKLTAASGVKISLLNTSGQAEYFAGVLSDNSVHLYHSFNIRLIRHDTVSSETDIIQGIESNNITAGYSVCKDAAGNTKLATGSANVIRETNYIQCTTGDIKNYLIDKNNAYQIYVLGAADMDFVGYQNEFPVNSEETEGIGVQGAVKSNLAYRETELSYAKMSSSHDPVDPYYYIKEDNRALFAFDAVDELDEEEIGTNTQNNSRLGVNDHFTYDNTINGKAVYNVTEVSNYSQASQIKYTLELYRKTTEAGSTSYKKVENISDYIVDVTLSDSDILQYNADPINTGYEKADLVKTNEAADTYIYMRNLNWEGLDKDAIFYADFSCKVLKDEAFTKKEYANYKILLSVELVGAENNAKSSYIIYTNAKIDPAMVDNSGT